MSWTLTKKLDSFAGPGEIKRREMVLDPQVSPEEIKRREVVLEPQVSPEEIKSREVELGSESGLVFCFRYSSTAVLQQCQQQCYGHCLCDSVPH